MITVQEMWNKLREDNNQIIPTSVKNSFEFLSNYNADCDFVLLDKFASLYVRDYTSNWIHWLTGFFRRKSYKYDGLKKSMEFEYNPIYNYDGKNTITTIYGEKSSQDVIGSTETNVNNDEISNATDTPQVVTTNARNTYDSAEFNDTDKTTTNAIHSTATLGATHSKTVESEHTNAHSEEEHTDTIIEEKSGNQGTTTTQRMIEEERQVLDFDFFLIIFNDIINEISMGVWS